MWRTKTDHYLAAMVEDDEEWMWVRGTRKPSAGQLLELVDGQLQELVRVRPRKDQSKGPHGLPNDFTRVWRGVNGTTPIAWAHGTRINAVR